MAPIARPLSNVSIVVLEGEIIDYMSVNEKVISLLL